MSFSYITFNAAGLIVCRDPERHDFQNGKSVLSFSVCDNRSIKNDAGGYDKKPHYFSVKYWCNTDKAEWWASRLQKGASIAMYGRLDDDRWEKDGVKRDKTRLVALQIIPPFIDKQPAPMGNDPQNPAEYFGGTEASDEVPF